MMVPYFDDLGRPYNALQNVYISFGFFGEEFSGFKKVNINAYNRALDSLNVANNVNQFELSQILAFGRSGMTSVPASNTIEAAPDKDIRRVAPNRERILDRETWGNVLALTGHRPGPDKKTGKTKLWGYNMSDPHYQAVKDELLRYCRENNIDTIVSGMAQGFDQLGAQVAIENGIKLVAAVPMEGQESTWPKDKQQEYHEILSKADMVYIVSPGPYSPEKMYFRNEWMIDNADEVFALYDGSEGGTGNAWSYAERVNKKRFQLRPSDVKIP